MADLEKVKSYIAAENSSAFLTGYVELAVAGYQVPIPALMELDGIKQGWQQIITESLGTSAAETFIDDISHIWFDAIKKQGGQMSESFSQEMLDILQGKTPQKKSSPAAVNKQAAAPKKSAPGPAGTKDADTAPAHTPVTAYEDQTVSSRISDDYRTTQSLRQKLITNQDRQQKLSSALKNADESGFLYYHLYEYLYGNRPEVPFELNHSAVMDRWAKILYGFSQQTTEQFQARLTDLWVNLVHSAGPITSPDALQKILDKLEITMSKKAKAQSPAAAQPGKPKSWLAKLIG